MVWLPARELPRQRDGNCAQRRAEALLFQSSGDFWGDLDSFVAQELLSAFLGSCIFMMALGPSKSGARSRVGNGAGSLQTRAGVSLGVTEPPLLPGGCSATRPVLVGGCQREGSRGDGLS